MGAVHDNPPPALLFFSLLAPDADGLDEACQAVEAAFGPLDLRSGIIAFNHTEYYTPEMGAGLARQWALSRRLIGQDAIVEIKRQTNALEDQRRRADGQDGSEPGGRRLNIDPGYLNLSKVVLATTKDFAHRLYLARGIYAEVTLTWRNRSRGFEPWPWTYPDHCEPEALRFFDTARERYKTLLRENDC